MDIRIDLRAFTPKNIYMRNGVKHYLDPYRQMLMPLNAESLLLYKMEAYANQVMGVPKNMMYMNQSFRKYGVDASKVVDIIIHDLIDGELKPVALIECKSPGMSLYHTTTTHIENFAKKLGINYLIVTNGDDVDSYISRQDRLTFWKIDNVPTYEVICSGHRGFLEAEAAKQEESGISVKPHKKKEAPVPNAKFSAKLTPKAIQPVVMGLQKALRNEQKRFNVIEAARVQVVGDCGLRKKLTGFGAEKASNLTQRALLIKDFLGNHQLVALDLAPSAQGAPVLSVTIDDADNRQVVLELDLSKTLTATADGFEFGCTLSQLMERESLEFVRNFSALLEKRAPGLLTEDQVRFGCLGTSVLDLDQAEVSAALTELIAFALILDEHRTIDKMSSRARKGR